MTMREHFLRMMTERREWPRGSADWEYRTEAARKYLWLHRGIPTCEWPK
ncbi:hypothetical protein [Salipiger thiooxidans]|nr:hypothetical protein [Salipiger thiooxidans]MCA0846085.1 hypothetical protein [Salipiger thiooxidans]